VEGGKTDVFRGLYDEGVGLLAKHDPVQTKWRGDDPRRDCNGATLFWAEGE